ncbi:MAG: DUF177 domain-containing protein [Chitinispirillaceae bacterium]|nr:DUF177 domain-containing protein [Chitinispirillaceae bacterium]
MVLDVRTIPPGRSAVKQETGLEAYGADLPPLSGKILCEAEIDRMGQFLYVNLRYKGKLSLECSRCVGVFAYPFSGELRLVVKEQPGRHGPSQDDETVDFYCDSRHPEVDVGSAIYEEIMTSLPIKPLCSEECGGIEVPNAGGATKEIDPRWEALKRIRKR